MLCRYCSVFPFPQFSTYVDQRRRFTVRIFFLKVTKNDGQMPRRELTLKRCGWEITRLYLVCFHTSSKCASSDRTDTTRRFLLSYTLSVKMTHEAKEDVAKKPQAEKPCNQQQPKTPCVNISHHSLCQRFW